MIPPISLTPCSPASTVVDVIDRRVHAEKAGKNYQACCPFHSEKTPSFNGQPDQAVLPLLSAAARTAPRSVS